ncbi:MAG: DUF4831 family protein [Rikenellaceae bacterium]|nr:DUF4831 family protein [Rikenellaceae bacterium]
MKRFLFMIALCVCSLQAWAQHNVEVKSSGVIRMTDDVFYCLPETAVWADIQVVETRTIVGPYARYAQKMLGLTVPVVNKSHWEITDVKLNYKLSEFQTDVEPLATANTESAPNESTLLDENGFARLGIDRLSSEMLSTEQMARLAAKRIFDIRKCRYDLITGELGENVYGAGLGVALDELRNMEEQLLEMFLGKRVVKQQTVRYVIDASRRNSIVCRFSETDGMLADDNLSGNPLIVKFSPIENDSLPLSEPIKGPIERYAVADKMQTTILLDKTVYAERIIPVFQLGYTIIEKPKAKR